MVDEEKEIGLEEEGSPSLYVHINSDGTLFLIPEDTAAGTWADIPRLKAELSRLEEVDGVLIYSIEPYLAGPSEYIDQVLELISGYELDVQFERYPHPAAMGYNKSFALYLFDAVDAAEMDVEGSKQLLEELNTFLEKMEAGTTEHREASEDLPKIELQLKEAENALKRLKEIEFEICTHTEGREQ